MTGAIAGLAFLAGAAFGPCAAVVVAGVMALVRLADADRHHLPWAVTVVVVAAISGAWRAHDSQPATVMLEPIPSWIDSTDAVRGTIVTAPTNNGRWQNFAVQLSESRGKGGWAQASGRVCVISGVVPVAGLSDVVWLTGAVTARADLTARYRAVSEAQGCIANLFAAAWNIEQTGRGWRRVVSDVRTELGRSLLHAAPGDAGALLSGLVTGDDHALSTRRNLSFVRTGTTHITAVSGSNLALIAGAAATIGSVGGWRRRLLWQATTLGGIWSYALLVGLEPPVARAALVATGVMVALRLGRRPDLLTLVMLAGAALVSVDPSVLWALSFQLSFAASLALSAVLPHLHPAGIRGWLGSGLTVAAVAQLATLPVQLSYWGTLSWVSVPANILIGPLVAVAFPVAAIAGLLGLVSPLVGDMVAAPAAYLAGAIFYIVAGLGESDWSIATVGTVPSLAGAAITGGVLLAIVLVSAEGRQWGRRMLHSGVVPGVIIAVATFALALIAYGFIDGQWR